MPGQESFGEPDGSEFKVLKDEFGGIESPQGDNGQRGVESTSTNEQPDTSEGNSKVSSEGTTDTTSEGDGQDDVDDQRLPIGEAWEEAHAIQAAQTPAARKLDEDSSRLAAITNTELNGSDPAFLDKEQGEYLAGVVDKQGPLLAEAKEDLRLLDEQNARGELSDPDEYARKRKGLEEDIAFFQTDIHKVFAPEFAEARQRVKQEVIALKETLPETKRKAGELFDELKKQNPDRYRSLDADGIRAWIERSADLEEEAGYWREQAERYGRLAERVETNIAEGMDMIGGRVRQYGGVVPEQLRLLQTGLQTGLDTSWDSPGWHKRRQAIVGFTEVFGARDIFSDGGTREMNEFLPFLEESLGRIYDENFNLSPKDKMKIYQEALEKVQSNARDKLADIELQQSTLLEKFKNGEDISEPSENVKVAA